MQIVKGRNYNKQVYSRKPQSGSWTLMIIPIHLGGFVCFRVFSTVLAFVWFWRLFARPAHVSRMGHVMGHATYLALPSPPPPSDSELSTKASPPSSFRRDLVAGLG